MADYTALKQAVRQVVLPNGNEEITGSVLQGALVEMIESLGKHFQYAGRATRTTNPGTPDEKVFYIAVDAGIYPHFDEIEVGSAELAVLKYTNGGWQKDSFPIAGGSGKWEVLGKPEDDIYYPYKVYALGELTGSIEIFAIEESGNTSSPFYIRFIQGANTVYPVLFPDNWTFDKEIEMQVGKVYEVIAIDALASIREFPIGGEPVPVPPVG